MAITTTIRRTLICSLGVLGLALISTTAFAQALQKVTIRTDFTPAGTHAALHLALVKGWFKSAGLDVDLQDGKGSLDTIQLVGGGKIDIGQLSVSAVPEAREAGMEVKSVACFARRSDLAVLVPVNSPIKTARDLKGKRLVVFPASPWVPLIDTFLKNAGLTKSDVNIVYTDVNAMYSVYSRGQVDGVLTLAPFALPVLEKTRPSRAIDAADYGIDLPALGLVSSDQFIASHPDIVKKVVATTIHAWEYIRDGHVDEAVQAIIKDRPNANLDPAILKGQALGYLKYFDTPNTRGKPIGWQSEKDWAAATELLIHAGLIKAGAKPTDFYTNEFLPKG
ncbi:MAG TPA: ABC transporter substrate-binding protein [Alphaproteobacteria bacterium]|nr:ABC transporter substrate-binding protein [Alphaproteobacteria bacterium]